MEYSKIQKEFCEVEGADYMEFLSGEKIVFEGDSYQDRPLYGARMEAIDEDGNECVRWCVWGGDSEEEEEDELFDEEQNMIGIEEIEKNMSEIVKFLGLGNGYNFIVEEDGSYDVWYEK